MLCPETWNVPSIDAFRRLQGSRRGYERGIVLAQYWFEGWTVLVKPKFLAHCLWIVVMGSYWLLADYGRSVVRPLFALVLSIFVFHALYLKVITPSRTASEANFGRAVWAFTIANAVPFVGALTLEKEVKEMILCAGAPPDRAIEMEDGTPNCSPVPTLTFQLLALSQSIVSGLLVFSSRLRCAISSAALI